MFMINSSLLNFLWVFFFFFLILIYFSESCIRQMQLTPTTYGFSQLTKLMAHVLGCIWESDLKLNVLEGVNHGNNNKPSTFRTLYLSRKDL